MQSALRVETKVLPINKIEINLSVDLVFYNSSPNRLYIQSKIEPCQAQSSGFCDLSKEGNLMVKARAITPFIIQKSVTLS